MAKEKMAKTKEKTKVRVRKGRRGRSLRKPRRKVLELWWSQLAKKFRLMMTIAKMKLRRRKKRRQRNPQMMMTVNKLVLKLLNVVGVFFFSRQQAVVTSPC